MVLAISAYRFSKIPMSIFSCDNCYSAHFYFSLGQSRGTEEQIGYPPRTDGFQNFHKSKTRCG